MVYSNNNIIASLKLIPVKNGVRNASKENQNQSRSRVDSLGGCRCRKNQIQKG
jgi:hypothetical protein